MQYNLKSSSNCGKCHGGTPAIPEDNTYMQYSTWSGSMMANVTRDSLYRSQTVDSANQSSSAFMQTLWENNGKLAPVNMKIPALQSTK